MMPWLSIVIPVYNPPWERFARCLDSLQTITIPHEVILVDDGSALETVRFYQSRLRPGIRCVRQENRGVSAARNLGIRQAQGTYLFFLDADDSLPETLAIFLEENYERLQADWILFEVLEYDEQKRQERRRNCLPAEERILEKREALTELVLPGKLNEAWGKLIRRAFLLEHKICFPEGCIQGEDGVFNARILRKASEILSVPCVGYRYYYSPDTQLRRLSSSTEVFFDSLLTVNRETDALLKEILEETAYRTAKFRLCGRAVEGSGSRVIKLCKSRHFSEKEQKILCKYLEESQCLKVPFFALPTVKGKFFYLLLKHQFWWGFRVLSIFKR